MLLAIDVGNTNVVFAVLEGNHVRGEWRLSTDGKRTADEYAIALSQLMQLDAIDHRKITAAIISCVVPQTLFALKTLCRKFFHAEPMVVGEGNLNLGIAIEVERPSEVGADRLVNAVAAYDKFRQATIILDFGTATTFDVVSEQGAYQGGVISPGINLSMEALHHAAAKLPKIAIERPRSVIGKSTTEAMQSGIYWGYVGLIEGITSRIAAEYGTSMVTIATGGLASLFVKATNSITHLEKDLTIQGLRLIYERNAIVI